jgi:hypothetical protein
MTYTHWEAAAAASKASRAVSSQITRNTPRGHLKAVIVIGPRIRPHFAYASADGIAIPEAYGKPSTAEIDAMKEWRIG